MKVIRVLEDQLYVMDHRLEHKGYIGDVIYDGYTGTLHSGTINTGSYSVALTEAYDVETLEKHFAYVIDSYLESCEEDGEPPVPPGEIDENRYEPIVIPQWLQELIAEPQPAESHPESAKTA